MADRYLRGAMSSASDVPDQGLDKGVLKVAGVVVLGAVMSILDVTVVNVAINTLARGGRRSRSSSSASCRAWAAA